MRVLRPQLSQALRLQDPQRLLLPQEEEEVLLRRVRHPRLHLLPRVEVRHFYVTLAPLLRYFYAPFTALLRQTFTPLLRQFCVIFTRTSISAKKLFSETGTLCYKINLVANLQVKISAKKFKYQNISLALIRFHKNVFKYLLTGHYILFKSS